MRQSAKEQWMCGAQLSVRHSVWREALYSGIAAANDPIPAAFPPYFSSELFKYIPKKTIR